LDSLVPGPIIRALSRTCKHRDEEFYARDGLTARRARRMKPVRSGCFPVPESWIIMTGVLPEPPINRNEPEETDLWWGSYAGRTLLPGFLACGLLTALVIVAAYASGATHPRRVAYWLTGPVWLLALAWCAYAMTAFTYRLTTRRLFRSRGFFRPIEQVELASTVEVRVRRSPVERWLGVGRVCVERGPGRPPVILKGVRNPELLATKILAAKNAKNPKREE
jgi:hypothetical protein